MVRKEFKDHVGGDMKKNLQSEKKQNWTTFSDDDDENRHPNLFNPSTNQTKFKTTLNNDNNNNSMYYSNPFLYH